MRPVNRSKLGSNCANRFCFMYRPIEFIIDTDKAEFWCVQIADVPIGGQKRGGLHKTSNISCQILVFVLGSRRSLGSLTISGSFHPYHCPLLFRRSWSLLLLPQLPKSILATRVPDDYRLRHRYSLHHSIAENILLRSYSIPNSS